jgi:exonuclease III
MIGITTYLSILTLNVNGPKAPMKRHSLANLIKKEDPTICCLQQNHRYFNRNRHRLKVKAGRRFTKPVAPKTRQE